MLHTPLAIVILSLLSIIETPSEPPASAAKVEIAWLPEAVSRWNAEIEAASATHGVDADLLAIVMLLESGGDPAATSPAGAKGLMQIMPSTAERIAVDRKLPVPSATELEDPVLNLDFSAYLLAELVADLTDGKLDAREVGLVASGYNAGIERTLEWQAGSAELSPETKMYRARAMRLWRKRGARRR